MRLLLALLCLSVCLPKLAVASIGATYGQCVLRYGEAVEREGAKATFVNEDLFYIVDFQTKGGRAESMLVGKQKGGHPAFEHPLSDAEIASVLNAVNRVGAWTHNGKEWQKGT